MITEDYVSFETAKLLKEKGFDECCYGYYYEPNHLSHSTFDITNSELESESYSAPTLQLAMKWLREMHGLFIGIDYANIAGLGFTYQATILPNGEDYSYCLHKKSYEEACEAAIKYCLENLI